MSLLVGAPKSAARRWAKVLSHATWPEVLRRHLLTTRAGVAVPLAAVEVNEKNLVNPSSQTPCLGSCPPLSRFSLTGHHERRPEQVAGCVSDQDGARNASM